MVKLEVSNISIRFGGLVALENVSLSVCEGQIFALIGPNGAGKTTMFNVISAVYSPQAGSVVLDGKDVTRLKPFQLAKQGLTRTFQNLQIFYRMTALENVMVGCHLHERQSILSHLLGLPSSHRQNRASAVRCRELLRFVGLESIAEVPAASLPYGVLKRLEIARALAASPKILLLDEPVAGCNATETAEVDGVIRKVAESGVAVLLVEHDMHMVMNLADHVHVLDHGRTIASGAPAEVRLSPAVIEAYLGAPVDEEATHAVG